MAAPRSRKMISGDTTWLREAGFVDIRVTPKTESRELISTWANCEVCLTTLTLDTSHGQLSFFIE